MVQRGFVSIHFGHIGTNFTPIFKSVKVQRISI